MINAKSLTTAATVLGLSASFAGADIIGDAITVTAYDADNMSDSATWTFTGQADDAGNMSYSMDESVELVGSASGETLATLQGAGVQFIADPVVDLNFDVTGGFGNTVVVVESGELTFGTINNAVAEATVGLSVTDNQAFPSAPGVSISPMGGASYLANTDGLAPAGENFASLLTNPINFTSGTQAFTDNEPSSVITGATSSISSRFQFTLSAGDFVSATSSFTVIPTPSGLALIGLGGLAAGVRRRR